MVAVQPLRTPLPTPGRQPLNPRPNVVGQPNAEIKPAERPHSELVTSTNRPVGPKRAAVLFGRLPTRGATVNEIRTITTDDGDMGVVARHPDGDFPVVSFFHHGPGLDEGSRRVAAASRIPRAGVSDVCPGSGLTRGAITGQVRHGDPPTNVDAHEMRRAPW